jgi:hypothetical protein
VRPTTVAKVFKRLESGSADSIAHFYAVFTSASPPRTDPQGLNAARCPTP